MTDAPPQNREAEEHVLGAMLISRPALDAVGEILAPQDFYFAGHGVIFQAALDLSAQGGAVDRLTLQNHLEQTGKLADAGGSARLAELAALVPAAGNAAHHARIVSDLSQARSLIQAGQEITRLGFERPGDTRELVDRAQQLVYSLGHDASGALTPIGDLVQPALDHTRKVADAGGGPIGTPSGLLDLDKLTLGFQPGNLILVAGRPSMGKSALAFNVAQHVALRRQMPVALFTLEMSRLEVMQRLFSREASVELTKIRSGHLAPDEWRRITDTAGQLAEAPLYIDDSTNVTPLELRGRLRKLRSRGEVALCVVDYLQLMVDGEAQYRTAEVGRVSRSLKLTAREMEVPMLALSQLNRRVEEEKRRPKLSDLRDSGSLEQDADLVLFVHRATKQAREGVLIVDKHRNGPTGDVPVTWLPKYASFGNALREAQAA